MRPNIRDKNTRALWHLKVAALLVLLAVSPVLTGAFQPTARAENDGGAPVASAAVETSEVTRWTVDSGGVVAATGGGFELGGTIGQPDAGFASGGRFTLSGGFWVSLADGDCNTDGGVDLIDFDGFQSCFSGPGGGVGHGCRCYDVDQDSDVDLSDVAAFQNAFTG
jgi:hypothetical protein